VAHQNMSNETRLAWSLPEYAARLGVSFTFLRNEIARGRLFPTRLGRRVLVSVDEANRYVRENTAPAAEPTRGRRLRT